MKTEPKPWITVTFAVELEVEYNPFNGKTPDEIADALADEIGNTVIELHPDIIGAFTSITSVQTHD